MCVLGAHIAIKFFLAWKNGDIKVALAQLFVNSTELKQEKKNKAGHGVRTIN